jgi:hypothetical protein
MFSRRVEQTAMQTSTKAAQAPRAAGTEQRVEVVFEGGEGEERVALRYSTWTEGIGWCCQKTIRVDAEQLDELHRAIAVARQRINRRRAAAGETPKAAQVIQLPSLS